MSGPRCSAPPSCTSRCPSCRSDGRRRWCNGGHPALGRRPRSLACTWHARPPPGRSARDRTAHPGRTSPPQTTELRREEGGEGEVRNVHVGGNPGAIPLQGVWAVCSQLPILEVGKLRSGIAQGESVLTRALFSPFPSLTQLSPEGLEGREKDPQEQEGQTYLVNFLSLFPPLLPSHSSQSAKAEEGRQRLFNRVEMTMALPISCVTLDKECSALCASLSSLVTLMTMTPSSQGFLRWRCFQV